MRVVPLLLAVSCVGFAQSPVREVETGAVVSSALPGLANNHLYFIDMSACFRRTGILPSLSIWMGAGMSGRMWAASRSIPTGRLRSLGRRAGDPRGLRFATARERCCALSTQSCSCRAAWLSTRIIVTWIMHTIGASGAGPSSMMLLVFE
jgi:hypothetical protein